MTKIEPIKVEAYRCPIKGCGRVLIVDEARSPEYRGEILRMSNYGQVKAHVAQPPAFKIPKGLVFFGRASRSGSYDFYEIVLREDGGLSEDHAPIYDTGILGFESNNVLINTSRINTLSLVEMLHNGTRCLLTRTALTDFKRRHGDILSSNRIDPVISIPELEKI